MHRATLLLFLPLACRTVPAADPRSTIEAIVRAQESAWNAGDVAGFMHAGYWNSPDLTFFSGGSVTRGFEPVLARYTRRYKAEGKEMGRLAFTQIEILPLSASHALARGRWDLDFEATPDVGGSFTLLFEDTPAGWRIVHDHTSIDG